MKLNQPLKDTRDKELSNLRFDLLLNVAGVIFVPVMSGKIYNACIEEGYPDWMIVISLIVCDLFFLFMAIVYYIKISQTKKMCNAFQENIDAIWLRRHYTCSTKEQC